jgi:hypothetical protein
MLQNRNLLVISLNRVLLHFLAGGVYCNSLVINPKLYFAFRGTCSMAKLFITILMVLTSIPLSPAKEWKDSNGKSLGSWTFKEISEKNIVTLENHKVNKTVPFFSLHLEDQKFIAAALVKELTKDTSTNMAIDEFASKYEGRPFLFRYEVTELSADYLENYRDLATYSELARAVLQKIPKVKVGLSIEDVPLPDCYIILVKTEASTIQSGDVVFARGVMSFFSARGKSKDFLADRGKSSSLSAPNNTEDGYASPRRIVRPDLDAVEIREGSRLPLLHHDDSGDLTYCDLTLNNVKISLAQKNKPERNLKLNNPKKELEEALKKRASAIQSVEARQNTQDRINQRRADKNAEIELKKRRMLGIP